MSEEITYGSMKDVKTGRYILIDGIPCRVVDVETSAPGKHGSAKMRVTGIGVFDGNKRTLLKPSSGDIELPLISKKKAQVVSISGNNAQVMNLETYETYDIPIPEDMQNAVKPGAEVEIMEYGEKRAISRVTGSV
ncbi:MAG: translation initiation factor IF-5A [Candidatus Micrarchaeia archaeon]